jgi:alpha-beta hydrolase superfamily lysophospholipase
MTPYSRIDRPEILALLFPAPGKEHSPCPSGAEDIDLETGSGVVLHCRYYSAGQDAPVLFLYPATAVTSQSFDPVGQKYLLHGVSVFLASYRGCGKNSGSPSVGAMYADSEQLLHLAIDWLKNDKGCHGPFFVMGQSLGSICAIDTVCNNGELIKGLILESGICGTASFLAAIGASPEQPVEQTDVLEKEGFNTLEKIEKITVPTLIFHGSRDKLVSVAEAEKIQASSGARTKQFFVIPGAEHSTVGETAGDLYVKTIKQFIDTVSGVNTWRQKRKHHKSDQTGRRS